MMTIGYGDLTVLEFTKCFALEDIRRVVLEAAIYDGAIGPNVLVKDCKEQIAALKLPNPRSDWSVLEAA